MSARPDALRLLLDTFLFADLTPAELRPLADLVVFTQCRRGDYIVRAGEQSVAMYIIASGHVKEVVATPAGEELVTALFQQGDVMGEFGLFSRDRTRIVSLIATATSEVASLEREALIEFLLKHPSAMLRMLQGLSEYGRASAHEMVNMAFRRIQDRLAAQLVELTEGDVEDHPRVTLPQGTLAGRVGATRENVNRALAALASQGYLALEGRSIVILERRGLQRLAGLASPLLPNPNRPLRPATEA